MQGFDIMSPSPLYEADVCLSIRFRATVAIEHK